MHSIDPNQRGPPCGCQHPLRYHRTPPPSSYLLDRIHDVFEQDTINKTSAAARPHPFCNRIRSTVTGARTDQRPQRRPQWLRTAAGGQQQQPPHQPQLIACSSSARLVPHRRWLEAQQVPLHPRVCPCAPAAPPPRLPWRQQPAIVDSQPSLESKNSLRALLIAKYNAMLTNRPVLRQPPLPANFGRHFCAQLCKKRRAEEQRLRIEEVKRQLRAAEAEAAEAAGRGRCPKLMLGAKGTTDACRAVRYDELGHVLLDANGDVLFFDEKDDDGAAAAGAAPTHGHVQYGMDGRPLRDAHGQVLLFDGDVRKQRFYESGAPVPYGPDGSTVRYDCEGRPLCDARGQMLLFNCAGQVLRPNEHGVLVPRVSEGGGSAAATTFMEPGEDDENGSTISNNCHAVRYDEQGYVLLDGGGNVVFFDAQGAEEVLAAGGQPTKGRVQYGMDGRPLRDELDNVLLYDGDEKKQRFYENGTEVPYGPDGSTVRYDCEGRPLCDARGQVMLFNCAGQVLRPNEHGVLVPRCVADDEDGGDGGATLQMHYDAHGFALRDENGNVMMFDPFGNVTVLDTDHEVMAAGARREITDEVEVVAAGTRREIAGGVRLAGGADADVGAVGAGGGGAAGGAGGGAVGATDSGAEGAAVGAVSATAGGASSGPDVTVGSAEVNALANSKDGSDSQKPGAVGQAPDGSQTATNAPSEVKTGEVKTEPPPSTDKPASTDNSPANGDASDSSMKIAANQLKSISDFSARELKSLSEGQHPDLHAEKRKVRMSVIDQEYGKTRSIVPGGNGKQSANDKQGGNAATKTGQGRSGGRRGRSGHANRAATNRGRSASGARRQHVTSDCCRQLCAAILCGQKHLNQLKYAQPNETPAQRVQRKAALALEQACHKARVASALAAVRNAGVTCTTCGLPTRAAGRQRGPQQAATTAEQPAQKTCQPTAAVRQDTPGQLRSGLRSAGTSTRDAPPAPPPPPAPKPAVISSIQFPYTTPTAYNELRYVQPHKLDMVQAWRVAEHCRQPTSTEAVRTRDRLARLRWRAEQLNAARPGAKSLPQALPFQPYVRCGRPMHASVLMV